MILTIPIQQDQQLFTLLNGHTKQYTDKIFDYTKNIAMEAVIRSRKMGLKLFTNSTPKELPISSVNVESIESTSKEQENYTLEEEELLRKLLKRPDK